jgi:hypothetical protein
MKYLTRANIAVVSQETGLSVEELSEYMIYHEEAGNHHAPIPRPRERTRPRLTSNTNS